MRRGISQAESFQEVLDLAQTGDAWGLDVVGRAAMLVDPGRSMLSAPLLGS